MNRITIFLVLALVLLSPLSGLAANWKYVKTAKTGDILYIDNDSVKRNGNMATILYKIQLKNPDEPLKKQGIEYLIFSERINCSNKTSSIGQFKYYDAQDKVRIGGNYSYAGFKPIPKDSLLNSVYDYVCK